MVLTQSWQSPLGDIFRGSHKAGGAPCHGVLRHGTVLLVQAAVTSDGHAQAGPVHGPAARLAIANSVGRCIMRDHSHGRLPSVGRFVILGGLALALALVV